MEKRDNPVLARGCFPFAMALVRLGCGREEMMGRTSVFLLFLSFTRVGLALPPGQDSNCARCREEYEACFKALVKAQAAFPSGQHGITSRGSVTSCLQAAWHHVLGQCGITPWGRVASHLRRAWHHASGQRGITPRGSAVSHPSGLRLLLPGVASEAMPGCDLPTPPARPLGRGSRSTGRVPVQASMSPHGVGTSRAVMFSPSAYRNRKLPSCPFLLAENRQRRAGPVRAGSTSSPRTPLLGGSCCGPGYF